ncbi:hypothetical protein Dimus_013596 [Dionaea muscipula]
MDSPVTFSSCHNEHEEALRLNHMCQHLTKLASSSTPLDEAYAIVMEGANELFEKVQSVIKESGIRVCTTVPHGPEAISLKSIVPESTSPEGKRSGVLNQPTLLDPNISQTKGRRKAVKGKEVAPSSSRIKSGLELSLQEKQRKCGSYNKLAQQKLSFECK